MVKEENESDTKEKDLYHIHLRDIIKDIWKIIMDLSF